MAKISLVKWEPNDTKTSMKKNMKMDHKIIFKMAKISLPGSQVIAQGHKQTIKRYKEEIMST